MNTATNHKGMPHFDSAKIHFFRFTAIPFLVFHRLIVFIAQPTCPNDEISQFTLFVIIFLYLCRRKK